MVIVEQFGEGLRGMTLLEDVCPWGWALRFQNPSLSLSLCLQLGVYNIGSQLLL